MSRDTLVLRGLGGLGDGVYQRPIIHAALRHYETVYLETPWPELYRDLPVRCTRFTYELRTQQKNVARQASWETAPEDGTTFKAARIKYNSQSLRDGGSILSALEQCVPFKVHPVRFDLPDFGSSPVPTDRPVAVLRPATLRSEWLVPARNPDESLPAEAARLLRALGYFVVLIADLEDGREWLVGPKPEADAEFLRGELGVGELCALIANAALVVAPVGFAVPVAMAYRTPCVVLAGGVLKWNGPQAVMDERIEAPVRWIMPDAPCYCEQRAHECDKAVSGFAGKFTDAVREVTA